MTQLHSYLWLKEIPNCLFYFHVSDAGKNITCQDPIIGIGEPGKVIQKLCQFAGVSRSPGQTIGGTVTYKCVGSQWKEETRACISAPINGLLQLAKVNLKPWTVNPWGWVSPWLSRILSTWKNWACITLKCMATYCTGYFSNCCDKNLQQKKLRGRKILF